MSVRQWKEEAETLVARGKFPEAAETYARLAQADPGEPLYSVRAGQQYQRSGADESAVYWYTMGAQAFAETGQWAKAMATAKVILDIDPEHAETRALLTRFHASRKRSSASTRHDAAPAPSPVEENKVPEISIALLDEDDTSLEHQDYYFFGGGSLEEGDEEEQEDEVLLLEEEAHPAEEEEEIVEATPDELSLDELLAQLTRIPLFSELTAPEFERMLQYTEVKLFEAGDQVLREGDPGDAFYVITSGEAMVLKADAKGNDVEVARLNEGTFFGEFAYLTRSRRTASISACTPLEVLEINRAGMDRLVAEFPRVRKVLGQFYKRRVMQNLLMVSPVFEVLDEPERKRLLQQFTYLPVSAGRTILREGEPARGLYVVVRGQVSVRKTVSGEERRVAMPAGGDFFGEMSLLSGEVVTASVYAEEKTGLLFLPEEKFSQVSRSYPALVRVLGSFAAERSLENAET